ncbi:MAG: hypothetical protein ACOYNG_07365 [Terrimicrobiaceae bacterium]|jgi:hypothetical protein
MASLNTTIRALLAAVLLFPACAAKKEKPAEPTPPPKEEPAKPAAKSPFAALFGIFKPRKKNNPPAAEAVQWIGEIRMVNVAGNFVLIESTSPVAPVPGENYLAVNRGAETAALRMTTLRNHPFLIADILSGKPSPGDRIYLPNPTAKPQSTPEPQNQTLREIPEPTETLNPDPLPTPTTEFLPQVTTRPPNAEATTEAPLPLPE